jgi:hypothetical protein
MIEFAYLIEALCLSPSRFLPPLSPLLTSMMLTRLENMHIFAIDKVLSPHGGTSQRLCDRSVADSLHLSEVEDGGCGWLEHVRH